MNLFLVKMGDKNVLPVRLWVYGSLTTGVFMQVCRLQGTVYRHRRISSRRTMLNPDSPIISNALERAGLQFRHRCSTAVSPIPARSRCSV